MSQKASPPSPTMCGWTTDSTALAAMAASTAEPPAFSTSTPASEASGCGQVTMPRGASVGGRPMGKSTMSGPNGIVRHAERHRLGHRRMGRQDLVDLHGGDLLTPAVDELLKRAGKRAGAEGLDRPTPAVAMS